MGVKLKDILKAVTIGTEVGKVFAPPGAGKILDIVHKSIKDEDDPANEGALRALAAEVARLTQDNKDLTEAILALHERVKKLEKK